MVSLGFPAFTLWGIGRSTRQSLGSDDRAGEWFRKPDTCEAILAIVEAAQGR